LPRHDPRAERRSPLHHVRIPCSALDQGVHSRRQRRQSAYAIQRKRQGVSWREIVSPSPSVREGMTMMAGAKAKYRALFEPSPMSTALAMPDRQSSAFIGRRSPVAQKVHRASGWSVPRLIRPLNG
jgi:hypothetical protein